MAPAERGRKLDVLHDDCHKLLSVICHQEVVRNKKIRWLMGSKSCKYDSKKYNEPEFLPETLVRNDDVSFQKVKASIETMTTPMAGTQQSYHVVADYLNLFDPILTLQPAVFVKTLSSALKHLKSDVLEHVARAVTGNNNMCSTTRGAMKRAILGILPEMFLQSKDEGQLKIIKDFSRIFRDPFSFRKQMKIITPVTAPLLSTIENIMQKLDDMPTQALIAMDRKFDGETVIPQLPIFITCKRDPLINRLTMKYKHLSLEKGDELPRPLAKALSVVSLTLKVKERQPGMPSTEFFPFTPEVVELQNDILMAIWSTPKVKPGELKRLRDLMDPVGKLPLKTFRSAVVKYLLEYLYECDEIDVPVSFFNALSFINRKSRRQLDFAKTSTDEEVEQVMNVSSQLKQIPWDSFPEDTDQEVLDACMSLESDDDDDDDTDDIEDDIIIDEDTKHLGSVREGMGDSEPVGCSTTSTDYVRSTSASIGGKLGCGDNTGSKDSQSFQSESRFSASLEHGSYNSIQSLCDDTSLLARRLIDRVLERLQTIGPEESKRLDDISSRILVQAVEELVPDFPQGSVISSSEMDAFIHGELFIKNLRPEWLIRCIIYFSGLNKAKNVMGDLLDMNMHVDFLVAD